MAAASLFLWLVTSVSYGTRADALAAVTVFPAWLWIALGLFFALLTLLAGLRRYALAVALLWLVFTFLFVDEWQAARHLLPAAQVRSADRLRVVSLNCAGGSAVAAGEVVGYRPDVVLLQESPGTVEVEALAQRLYGNAANAVCGPDGSLMAAGTVEPLPLARKDRMHFVAARVRLPATKGSRTLYVISLRLSPTIFRMDLWSPECWRAQRENRRTRREELRAVIDLVAGLPMDSLVLVGGDFNAPAGDAVFRLLAARGLRDAFAEAGRGWGDTIINDLPFHRIDQVWFRAPTLHALDTRAHRTENSDHRMVACDFAFAAR
jgi:endonuclease/exonuclease/phosphatase (EEP) superfamily protein YafD